jgi:adenine-specific DNA methylase
MTKRLIEHNLPQADISIGCNRPERSAVSAASAREKNIRHGHPSTLHIW